MDPNANAPQQGHVGSGGQNNNLGQAPQPTYPDWLLNTERGPSLTFNDGSLASTTPPTARPRPDDGLMWLYRLRFMFGHDQTLDPAGNRFGAGESWSSPIAYLLLVAAQIDLWNNFLASLPNRSASDPWPSKGEFATYCGAIEFMHARHTGKNGVGGGPHRYGNAVDIEYTRTPYLPMWNGPQSYHWDLTSYAGFSATGPESVRERLIRPCVAVLDAAFGGRSPTLPAATLNADLATVLQWFDSMSQLNSGVIAHFAGNANRGDYSTVVWATPMGTTTRNPDGTLSGGGRHPENGIMGFTRPVVSSMLGARVSALQTIVPFDDGALQSRLQPYSFQWAPFVFGSDIQHFDIERWKSINRVEPPQADQAAAQHSIETALGTRRAYNESNNGPWVDEKTQWPTLPNGNVLV